MKGIKNLTRWAKPFILMLIIVILLTIINPLTYSYVPQFIKYVIDVVLVDEPIEGVTITLPSFFIRFFDSFISNKLRCIFIVGVTMVIFQLIRGLMMFVNGYFKGKVSEGIAYNIRCKLFGHIQNLSYSYQNKADTGDLIQRCTSDIDTVKSFLATQLPEVLYIIASFTAGAYQMYQIEPKIMFVTMAVVPITLTASIVFLRIVSKKFEEIEESEAKMTSALQENVNGVRVVKAFNNEKYEIDKYTKRNHDFKRRNIDLTNKMALYWGLSDGITVLQYALTVGVAVAFSRRGLVSTGDVVVCLMYIGMLVYPIRGLGRIIGDFGKAVVSANRIQEILEIKDEYESSDGTLTPKITGEIEFSDASFKFDDDDKHLLENLNFKINAGETVALVGRTGSGKSTIASILTRMLDYDSGSIKLSGVELKDISKKWVRKNVGVVLQDPFLYARTILDNIKVGDSSLSDEKVYEAAKTASIDKDIREFSEGYNTFVGEKGVTLSGGQKQRIAIARMLILEKPIIIFDDSLSAVDTKTDLSIRSALKSRDKKATTIIITHRITTAKEADKIIVLENNTVSAIGTHEELSKAPGLYKSLWDIQGALEAEFDSLKGGEVDE